MTRQRTGIDVTDCNELVCEQVIREALPRTKVAIQTRNIAHNQTLGENRVGLDVLAVNACVANVWVGESNNLFSVRRICQNFLVTSHCGVKHHFSDRHPVNANGDTVKTGTVS